MTRWWAGVAALLGVRMALPLVVLAASPAAVLGLAPYRYDPLAGDAYAYYFAARELIASWQLGAAVLAALALLLGAAAAAIWLLRRRPAIPRRWAVVGAALVVCTVLAVPVAVSDPSGAGAIGWPLLWSLPLLPYRAAGLPLDPDVAFGVALALSLVANAATLVAVAWAARRVSGRAGVGLLAAALVTFWPYVARALAGSSAWENKNWLNDIGLTATTEPLSTALVTVALALLLDRPERGESMVAAGLCLGFAVAVRPTNLAFLIAAAAWLAWARRDTLKELVAAAATPLPIVVAFLGKGYFEEGGNDPSPPPEWHAGDVTFSLSYGDDAFADSTVFGPRTLAVLLPLAVVGLLALGRRDRPLLVAFVLATPVVYAWFWATPVHPRYLYASLPALLILCAAGLWTLALAVAALGRREHAGRLARPQARQ